MGSINFFILVLFSAIMSPLLMILMSLTMNWYGWNQNLSSFNSCAVGFSAILFSLKYVLNQKSSGMEYVVGIPIVSKYVCWFELVIISLITPNASFLGHLAGILAGVTYMRNQKSLNAFFNFSNSRRYTYHTGTTSAGVNGSGRWDGGGGIIDDIDEGASVPAGIRSSVAAGDDQDFIITDDIDGENSSALPSTTPSAVDTAAIRVNRLQRFGQQQQQTQQRSTKSSLKMGKPPAQVFI
jgi:hypothetical protein